MKEDKLIVDIDDKTNLTQQGCQDWWESKVKAGYFDEWKSWTLQQEDLFTKIPITKESKILELGCGYGRHLINFAKWSNHIYGVDISKTIIDQCKVRFPNMGFKVTNGYEIPYEDNYFDFVTSCFVLQHTNKETIKKLLKESIRVLQPGGYFLHEFLGGIFVAGEGKNYYSGRKSIEESGMYNNGFTEEEIRNLCKELSMKIEWIETIDMNKSNEGALNYWLCCKK